jgi:APA family basic amino acid/polyamine antiporter
MGIWNRKPIDVIELDSDQAPRQMNRTLKAYQLVLLGVGAIVGAGLFSITGIAAAQHAGPAILISFVIAALACSMAGLCYSELASTIPVSGSAYTYAYVTMGQLPAWVIGWTLILEYAIGASAVAISWSAYVVSILNDLGIFLPVSLIASPWHPTLLPEGVLAYGVVNLPAVLIVVIMSLILMIGIEESALINTILVVIKVCVIIIFVAVGVQFINWDNFFPFIPENTGTFGEYGWSGILRAAGIVFFAYIGFDCISTASQETINPQKNLPIGILGSLTVCTILYLLFAFVLVGLVPYKQLAVAAPVALAIDQTPYHWLNGLVKLAIVAGFSSVILVMLLGQSRIFYAMAHDGFLPKAFSDLHDRWHTPWKSTLILMFFVGGISALVPLEVVGNMTSIGTLFAFAIVCGGVIILRHTHPEYPRSFTTPWVPLVPLLGIFACGILMLSLSMETWMRFLIWLAMGLIVYVGYSRHHVVQHKSNDAL